MFTRDRYILILIKLVYDICGHEIFPVQRRNFERFSHPIEMQMSNNCFFHSILTGFEFSEFEPSALVQRQGGPCAVIAPVQAFLLKTILSMETSSQDFSSVSALFISFCVATDVPDAFANS